MNTIVNLKTYMFNSFKIINTGIIGYRCGARKVRTMAKARNKKMSHATHLQTIK
jgi:hypothetical protein